MKCSGSCKEFCGWIKTLPHHKNYALMKEDHPSLPECFKPTLLGESVPGALRQYRGPYGAHVHEFDDRWVLHRDLVDAEKDPLGHLISDAPEYLLSIGAGLATYLLTGRVRHRNKAMAAGWALGAFALLLGKMEKAIGEDEREEVVGSPR